MKTISTLLASAAALTLAQPALAATTFEGYATVTDLRTSDPGLVVYATPTPFGPFSLNPGEFTFTPVLTIGTQEQDVELCLWGTCDVTAFDIEVGFTFTDPTGATGAPVTGSTRGSWILQRGIVQWDGPVEFTFGDGGKFRLTLSDVTFDTPGSAVVNGKFKLISDALPSQPVPEPAAWALMVGGFGALGAAMRRRRTTVSFA